MREKGKAEGQGWNGERKTIYSRIMAIELGPRAPPEGDTQLYENLRGPRQDGDAAGDEGRHYVP